ncbi:EboA domain-containing protein [Streptantibioticus parmotrematis]|uniref:EboA domain-containing protein n=1 Tax=Streptantibioticus parmotrematis TaxID=2873249 RepID=UPI0033C4005A
MIDTLHDTLSARLPAPQWERLGQWRRRVAESPADVREFFPRAGREIGRGDLVGPAETGHPCRGWRTDDAARTLLLAALPQRGDDLVAELRWLYETGDAAERHAVLRSLDPLDLRADTDALDGALPLVHDALRVNDLRMVTAAVGDYTARHLPAPAWRHAVLKCVFTGIPLSAVSGLDKRADPELLRMLGDFAAERTAAGRAVPPDVATFLRAHPAP